MARKTTQPTTELGRQLEKERANRNLNMKEMADYIGVSKPAYLGWLRGVTPQQHHLELIAEKLETKPARVLAWMMTALVITWNNGEPVIQPPPQWVPRPIEAFAQGARLRAA